jgi:hypothetical protein
VRRVANWACKSNSETTLVVAFRPTSGGDEGKIKVGGDDGERLRGVGERPTGERQWQLRSR